MTQFKRLHMVRPGRGQPKKERRSPLFSLCIFFLVGALLGSIFATLGGSHPQLAKEIKDYIQGCALGDPPTCSLHLLLWDALSWPTLLLLFSFGPPGIIGIPALFLIRGFLLSYACTSFVAMYGLVGVWWNVIFFGTSALILLPVIVCVGQWTFSNTCKLHLTQESSSGTTPPLSMFVWCGLLLVAYGILQGQVLPFWLPNLCAHLLSLTQ